MEIDIKKALEQGFLEVNGIKLTLDQLSQVIGNSVKSEETRINKTINYLYGDEKRRHENAEYKRVVIENGLTGELKAFPNTKEDYRDKATEQVRNGKGAKF